MGRPWDHLGATLAAMVCSGMPLGIHFDRLLHPCVILGAKVGPVNSKTSHCRLRRAPGTQKAPKISKKRPQHTQQTKNAKTTTPNHIRLPLTCKCQGVVLCCVVFLCVVLCCVVLCCVVLCVAASCRRRRRRSGRCAFSRISAVLKQA